MAYAFDQKNKASVLAFNEQRNQLSTIPGPLKKKEQVLKAAITRLTLSVGSNASQEVTLAVDKQVRDLEIALGKVQEEVSSKAAEINLSPPSVQELQKQLLDKRTLLVSYHLGEHTLTSFVISSSGFKGTQKKLYAEFFSDLHSCISQLHGFSDTITSEQPGKRLSSFLLDGIRDKKYSRLIIIPDDELAYLPFESLELDGRYLVENFAVQYQYSTVLLKKENLKLKEAPVISFTPFVTSGFTDSSLHYDALPASNMEIAGMPGQSFTGKEATKKNFLNQVNGSVIIHLATHAVATDTAANLSYIMFAPWDAKFKTDYLLYAPEIYNLSLQKNPLIILSACETGYGNLVKGEGVMSLSRAFAYAGCPNVVTSLWKADDASTAYLIQKFYRFLKTGLTVDEAMQLAKKEYLNDRSVHPRKKTPAYWAHLVYIGNYQQESMSHHWRWIMAGLAAFTFAFLIFYPRKRKQ
jgi:CHAT domain-containing protein